AGHKAAVLVPMRNQQTDRLPQRVGDVGGGIAETNGDVEFYAGGDASGYPHGPRHESERRIAKVRYKGLGVDRLRLPLKIVDPGRIECLKWPRLHGDSPMVGPAIEHDAPIWRD